MDIRGAWNVPSTTTITTRTTAKEAATTIRSSGKASGNHRSVN